MSLIKNLYKKYSNKDFQFEMNIPELELPDHGITALWGPSGSGKTTFFRMLLGLEKCDELEWWMDQVNIASQPIGERKLGVVFQNLELFPHMSARQNLQFAGQARGMPPVQIQSRIEEISAKLQIQNILENNVQNLSGGQKQRVALARALIAPVRYLFLDEPFSALDTATRNAARKLVKEVIRESNTPTLLITHDEQDVRELADHVLEMDQGRIVNSSKL
ncbi:MAG: ATP-binding cassette domain-containing protein [Bdellovibrionales bacterium]